MSGLGSFLQGAAAGYATQRTLAQQDEDRAYTQAARADDLKMRGIQGELAQGQLADVRDQRSYKDELKGALTDATDPADLFAKQAVIAKKHGNVDGYASAINNIANYRQKQLETATHQALNSFVATGDTTALANAFNQYHPSGSKVAINANGDGTFTVQTSGPDAKIINTKKMSADELGQSAMMLTDPKFTHELFKTKAVETIKASEGIRRDTAKETERRTTEEVKGGIKLGVENAKIAGKKEVAGLEHTNRLSEIGARNSGGLAVAAEHGRQARLTQDEKAKLDNKGVKGEDARVKLATGAVTRAYADPMSQLEPATRAKSLRAQSRAGELVRAGTDPEKAAQQAVDEQERGSTLDKNAPVGGASNDFSNLWK
jgi:hypothetical protein